jgi:hypothetical protein
MLLPNMAGASPKHMEETLIALKERHCTEKGFAAFVSHFKAESQVSADPNPDPHLTLIQVRALTPTLTLTEVAGTDPWHTQCPHSPQYPCPLLTDDSGTVCGTGRGARAQSGTRGGTRRRSTLTIPGPTTTSSLTIPGPRSLLSQGLNASVFLDSDDLSDLNKLCDHVRATDVLVLLQTRDILTRPWCLLESAWRALDPSTSGWPSRCLLAAGWPVAHPDADGSLASAVLTAAEANVPIVCATLMSPGKGYDFGEATKLLCNLEAELSLVNPDAIEQLRKFMHMCAAPGETLELTVDQMGERVKHAVTAHTQSTHSALRAYCTRRTDGAARCVLQARNHARHLEARRLLVLQARARSHAQ